MLASKKCPNNTIKKQFYPFWLGQFLQLKRPKNTIKKAFYPFLIGSIFAI